MWAKIKQDLAASLCVCIAAPSVAGLILALRFAGLLQLLEWAALDQFFRLRPPEPRDERIVIVAIKESDINQAGQWPISDKTIAQLLAKIKQQKPTAIGFDIFRPFPVAPGQQELQRVFTSTPNLIGIKKVVGDEGGVGIAPPPELSRRNQIAASDVVLDPDGKLRRALVSVNPTGNKPILSLAGKLALIYLNEKHAIKFEPITGLPKHYKLGKAKFAPLQANDGGYVRSDSGGYQILLNFIGPPGNFRSVSMGDVLQGNIPPDLFSGRIVLIGAAAQSLRDFFITPYTRSFSGFPDQMTGVEVHANVISQILSAALQGRPLIVSWDEPIEWLCVFAWSCLGSGLAWKLGSSRPTAYSLLLAGSSLIGGSFYAFVTLGLWVPVVPSLLALVVSGVTITACIAYIERQDRQTVMNLFARHVTPKIAETIWRERQQFLKQGQLVAQKMTATVLFSDLKGFTSIAETMDPATLMLWLNDYMKAMAAVVLEHDGVVDKFIGDAVMAVFGVPVPRTTEAEIAEDAAAAVSCALAMAEKLNTLNQQWQAQGLPTVSMRVGIATGPVVAGSLGSAQRQDYTTIGDSVNVAARLESFDKSIDGSNCRILIAEETYHYIHDRFKAWFLVRVRLKGRSGFVKIYQVPVK